MDNPDNHVWRTHAGDNQYRSLIDPFERSRVMDNDIVAEAGHELVDLTADIVAAYVSHNALGPSDLPKLIADVHAALNGLGDALATAAVEVQKPAVSIRKSVTPDFIVCLEDGKKFKSLKRHLHNAFDLTPEQYREKWHLPAGYPMVAPNYSATRSNLAKANGLGRKAAVTIPKRGRAKVV